ncbi:c-type cytochrome biogenesis protein CcmI [Psychromonas arctica]|uniref:c-type cytochrome biogenesis protein CcmI n=1 Tax=Psychromonas arctica TaxID=168275 RepID=UPI002FD538C7
MISSLVITIILLLLFFSTLVLVPFIRHRKTEEASQQRRNQLNHELYDIRLQEVEEDLEQGVVTDKQSIVAELQYNLLDDIDDNHQLKTNTNKLIWLPGIVFLIITSVSLYWSVGAFKQVSEWQSTLERYPAVYQKLFRDSVVEPDQQDLQDLMVGLRSHLVEQPDDAKGWALYSRLGSIFNDPTLAIEAIDKAVAAQPENIEIAFESIELKMKIGDEYEKATAELQLKNLLKQYPENYQAWSMYGLLALQQENYEAAIKRWQTVLPLLSDSNGEQVRVLNNSIAYAQQQLAEQKEKDNTTVNLKQYEISITLAKQVSYEPGSSIFVYAQAVDGSPMPIAAVKLTIDTFPMQVFLSDANAMVEGSKLSNYEQFIIKARISADGTANTQNGQWFGQSHIIKSGDTTPVNIIINQQS